MENNELIYHSSFVYRICLNEYNNQTFKGVLYSSRSEHAIAFETFDDFIIKMDRYMDSYGPQSFQDKRTLTEAKKQPSTFSGYMDISENMNKLKEKVGTADTFTICVYSRRNTEWQGILFHKEEEVSAFSTIIDLTNLLSQFIK